MRILIADDSRVMRQIIIRTLRQVGYDEHDLVEAENGRDAVLKAAAEPVDLLLCDWHMPEMSGMECLRALRAAGSTAPFGFITSDVSVEVREEAAAAGAVFVIGKPFSPEVFQLALGSLAEGAGGLPAAPASGSGPESGAPTPGRHSALPAAKDIRDMFGELLGRPVTVSPGRRLRPTHEDPASVAVYADRSRSIAAVCLMDLPLSAYAAGALALLPPGGVQDRLEEDGELGPVLGEALHEVANVLSGVVNTAGSPHLHLQHLHLAGTHLPEEYLVMAGGFDRLDLLVEVSGYGEGSLSLVLTA